MKNQKTLVGVVLLLLSLFFGLDTNTLQQISPWLDPPPAGTVRVLEVVDGDTLVVQFGDSKERVRLIGVDTPETHHPDKAVQCYGQAASDFLKHLAEGNNVRLEADPTNSNRDIYDRLLRYAFTEDDQLINQLIIEQGYGFAYTAFPFERLDDFRATQAEAKQAGRGLWSNCEIEQSGDRINTAPAEAEP